MNKCVTHHVHANMLNHEQNNGGLPCVIYQQHSVPVAVVAVAAEMDFLAEVHVDATVAL